MALGDVPPLARALMPTGFRQPRDVARLLPGDAQSEPLGSQVADWIQGQTGWRPGTTPSWMPHALTNLSDRITAGTGQARQDISDVTQRVTGQPMSDEDFNILMSLGTMPGTIEGAGGGRLPRGRAPRVPRVLPRAAMPEGETLAPPRGHNLPPELIEPETPAEASAPDVGPEGAGTPEPTDIAPKSIRQNIEEAVAAQEQKGAPEPAAKRRAITDVKLRDLSPEEATAIAERGDHLIQDKTGQYVGAPRGVDTPEKLQAMRDNFDRIAAMGIPGRMWYPKSQEAVSEITGGDPERERLAAAEMGLWSPQADPEANFGFLAQGHNAYEAGQPLPIVRTGAQARNYLAAREADQLPKLGKKTGPFALHLDPTQTSPTTSVNDIWHARAYGYTNKDGGTFDRALTAQEHSFLDAETLLAARRANQRALGGFTDWGSGNVQASAWVGAKAKQLVEEKGMSWEDALEQAKVDFSDVLEKHTAAATYEQTPGAGVGHARGMVDAPYAERAAYGAKAPWVDPSTGEDVLYRSTGFYQRPTLKTQGYYTPEGKTQAEVNPAFTARPIIDYAEGAEGRGPSAVSRGTLDAVEATRAYLDAQEMGAHHKLATSEMLSSTKASQMNSVFVPLERSLTPDEMTRLGDAMKRFGLSPSDTGRGVSLLNFGDGPKPDQMLKLLKGDLGNAVKKVLPDTVPQRARQFSNALLQNEGGSVMAQKYAGTGTATRALLGTIDNPDIPAMASKLDSPELRQAALDRLQRDEAYAAKTNDPIRQDIQNARRIIAEGGLPALRAALKAGKIPLPAVAGLGLAGLGAEFMRPGQAQAAEKGNDMANDSVGAPLDYSGLSGADLASFKPAMDLRPLSPGEQALAAAARRHMMAQMLSSQGQGGDTILAHINPQEALALKMMGGSGTRNPATGLPEFQTGGDDGSDDGSGGLGGGVGGVNAGGGYGYGHASGPTNAGDPGSSGPSGGWGQDRGVFGGGGGGSAALSSPGYGGSLGNAMIGGSFAGLGLGPGGLGYSGSGDPLGGVSSALGGGGTQDPSRGSSWGGGDFGGIQMGSGGYDAGSGGFVGGDPALGDPGQAAEGSLAAAQDAMKNRGLGEMALEAIVPGYEVTKPSLKNPASWAGDTYHTDVNPAAIAGGLIGSALAGPVGGIVGGKLLGAGYNALGGPTLGLGGLFGGGGTPSPAGLAAAAGLAGRGAPGAPGSDMSSTNPHVNAAYGAPAGTYPLRMGQSPKEQKRQQQQANMYRLARLGLLMGANRAV